MREVGSCEWEYGVEEQLNDLQKERILGRGGGGSRRICSSGQFPSLPCLWAPPAPGLAAWELYFQNHSLQCFSVPEKWWQERRPPFLLSGAGGCVGCSKCRVWCCRCHSSDSPQISCLSSCAHQQRFPDSLIIWCWAVPAKLRSTTSSNPFLLCIGFSELNLSLL